VSLSRELLATGGVVAIVLGFAFREIGENLLAGIFLNFSRPFEVGDLVGITNDVMTQCWRVLRGAGMTFSTDVTSALEIKSAPPLVLQKG